MSYLQEKNTRMKTILLATDFSHNAENAISYALDFFKEDPCDFLLLHAYKVDGYEESSRLVPKPAAQKMETVRKEKETQLEEYANTLALPMQETGDLEAVHTFRTTAVNKPLVQAVQDILKDNSIELLVIGTQGYTGSSEVVYGSNTVNLMEEIQRCPILAVPAHVPFTPLKELVLANSFKRELLPEDLQFLTEISKKFSAPVRVLHISEEGGLSEDQIINRKGLRAYFRRTNTPYSFHELEYLGIPLGIYAFTESRGSDLIAFINKKHSMFEKLLLDPLYKDLAHYSKVPVLVLHQP